jgi:hypothetical protein
MRARGDGDHRGLEGGSERAQRAEDLLDHGIDADDLHGREHREKKDVRASEGGLEKIRGEERTRETTNTPRKWLENRSGTDAVAAREDDAPNERGQHGCGEMPASEAEEAVREAREQDGAADGYRRHQEVAERNL